MIISSSLKFYFQLLKNILIKLLLINLELVKLLSIGFYVHQVQCFLNGNKF